MCSSDLLYEKFSISRDSETILKYQGGPGSFLGIGKTTLPLATDNSGAPTGININNFSLYGFKDKNYGYNGDGSAYSTLGFEGINKSYEEVQIQKVIDFRKKLRFDSNTIPGPRKISYNPGDGRTLEVRTRQGDPGNPFKKNLNSYQYGDGTTEIYSSEGILQPGGGIGAASFYTVDDINATDVDHSSKPTDPPKYRDLVDFRIGVINNNNPGGNRSQMYFRAFLDNISDQYNSNWDPTRYIGRGENFYT